MENSSRLQLLLTYCESWCNILQMSDIVWTNINNKLLLSCDSGEYNFEDLSRKKIVIWEEG